MRVLRQGQRGWAGDGGSEDPDRVVHTAGAP